ncbi:structural maintenance of chromosomes protein 1-like isoform X2 [Varroa destructor]|uniref:SMC hinge domain-containing protein n=1 Tax=Varroa destructor TaxID=109461 RepID=A0A7M7KQX1_VARDE|nr:structural maintenance of chromosomes protein 1-like isoform X2 [Varroa destructor]
MEKSPKKLRLISLSIEHFRSFEYAYVVRFSPKVTAIVGPNWAGKSNILKALVFGLGQSGEEMFVDDIRSLINDNYLKRCQNIGDDGFCSVAILANVDGEEINFKRRLYQDLRESFQINDEPYDAAKYRDKLFEYGIRVDSWGLVLRQGSIQNIGGKTPKEMSAFLEKMSGSHLLAADVKEADKKLRKTLGALVNAKSELGRLRLTRQRYKNFANAEQLWHEVNNKEQLLDLARLRGTDEKIRICQNEIFNFPESEEEQERQRLQELKLERLVIQKQLKKNIETITNEERLLATAQDTLQKISTIKQRFASLHSEAKQQLGDLNARRAKIEVAISEAKADQQQAQIKLPGVKKKVESARNALEPIQVDTDIFVELRNLEGAFYQEHRENLQQVESLEERRQSHMMTYDNLSVALKSEELKLDSMNDELQELELRRTKYKSSFDSVNFNLERARSFFENRRATFDTAYNSYASQVKKTRELTMQRDYICGRAKRTNSRRHTERILDGLTATFGNHVVGVLGNLIIPCKPEYMAAVRKVLGRYRYSIVVDSRTVMRQCLSFLKESNEPVMPVLVLPSTAPKWRPLPKSLTGRALMFESICMVTQSIPLHLQNRVLYLIRDLYSDVVFCNEPNTIKKLTMNKPQKCSVVMSDGNFLSRSGVFESAKKEKTSGEPGHAAAITEVNEKLAEATICLRETEATLENLQELGDLEHGYELLVDCYQDAEKRLEILSKEIESKEGDLDVLVRGVESALASLRECTLTGEIEKKKLRPIETIEKRIRDQRQQLLKVFGAKFDIPLSTLLKLANSDAVKAERHSLIKDAESLKRLELTLDKAETDICRHEDDLKKIDRELESVISKEQHARTDAEGAQAELTKVQQAVDSTLSTLDKLKIQDNLFKQQLVDATAAVTSASQDCARRRRVANKLQTEIAKLRSDRASLLGQYVEKLPRERKEDFFGATFDDLVMMQVDYTDLPEDVCTLRKIDKFCNETELLVSELRVLLLESRVSVPDPNSLF